MNTQAATACLPGKKHYDAVALIHGGISEPLLGSLGHAEVQLCPQHPTRVDDELVDRLLADFPDTRFRLHASVRLRGEVESTGPGNRRVIHDASYVGDWRWFREAARLSRKLGATAYTVHAGRREHATLSEMRDNVSRLIDMFGCLVGVEGLYPERDTWLIQDWKEYAWLLDSGLYFALDLSHLNIVARKTRCWEDGIMKEMLASDRCLEIHVSSNDGLSDRHLQLKDEPQWWALLSHANPKAVVFSEGCQARPDTQ